MIAAGSSIDMQDKHRQTALMWAAGLGRLEIASSLVLAGASIDIQDKFERTALNYTVFKGKIETV
jgi:ankyrin repeat protein